MLWIIIVGFVAGILARLIAPGPNNPTGFILTIVLGVVGAFLATFIGQAIGWYQADQGAGIVAATARRGGRAVHLAPAGDLGPGRRSRHARLALDWFCSKRVPRNRLSLSPHSRWRANWRAASASTLVEHALGPRFVGGAASGSGLGEGRRLT